MEKCGGAAIGSMGWPTREWPEGPTLERNALLHYIRVSQSGDSAMTTLTVTARGQVTFRKDVLQHLGIKPGEKIELDLLPDGRAELKASRPKGSFRDLYGFLKGKTNGQVLTIEEINEAIAEAGAAAGADKE
jgi:bifunctional DNA-binding transcriptional regulator/antitoxin component of YhaV-PrlF toxin-antitoxin module